MLNHETKHLAQHALSAAYVNDQKQKMRLFRAVTALSYGLNPAEYDDNPAEPLFPTPQLPTVPHAQIQPARKKASSLISGLAMAGLIGAGGGTAATLLINKLFPPQVAPATLEAEWKFDPDNGGLKIGDLKPTKP